MSTSDEKRRPLRKLIFFTVLAGGAVAIRNALKDKGGSYEAPAQPPAASVPVPPAPPVRIVTAEDIIAREEAENLDEFADPVKPSAAAADPTEEEPSEAGPAIDAAVAEAADPQLKETPGKIDPFGIR